jgi:hypothetical protein
MALKPTNHEANDKSARKTKNVYRKEEMQINS